MPRVLVVLCAAIVLTGAIAIAVFGRSGPDLDPARELSLRLAVEHHLESNHWRGILGGHYPRARWFCATTVIEAVEDQESTRAGVQTVCDEYVAVDGELLVGSGESVPRLATTTSPPKQVEVLQVEDAPDGAGNSEWVEANFSWTGVKKLRRAQSSGNLTSVTSDKARAAFGLPADAPVRPRF